MIFKRNNFMLLICTLVFLFFYGAYGYCGGVYNIDQPNADQIKKIMKYGLKSEMKDSNGKIYEAFLYADDMHMSKEVKYSCHGDDVKGRIRREGEFFLYLYDVEKKIFLPKKTKIFEDWDVVAFGVEGAEYFVFKGSSNNKSDVLFISQFVSCRGSTYMAYGFSKDLSYLEPYVFKGKNEDRSFSYEIDYSESENKLTGYSWIGEELNKLEKTNITLSDQPGQFLIKTVCERGFTMDSNIGSECDKQ